jgi:hypothetical protein
MLILRVELLYSNPGSDITLVRINPDFPMPHLPANSDRVISIMERGIKAVKTIDSFIRTPHPFSAPSESLYSSEEEFQSDEEQAQ